MNEIRDKFLTEQLGECWHEFEVETWCDRHGTYANYVCPKCKETNPENDNNFSTWEGFGKLWEWSQKQEWLGIFCVEYGLSRGHLSVMENPDRFADAVYEFLKDKNK